MKQLLMAAVVLISLASCKKSNDIKAPGGDGEVATGKTVKHYYGTDLPVYRKYKYDDKKRLIETETETVNESFTYTGNTVSRIRKYKSDPSSEWNITGQIVNGRIETGTFIQKSGGTTLKGTVEFTYNSDGTLDRFKQISDNGKTSEIQNFWNNGNLTQVIQRFEDGTMFTYNISYTNGKADKQNLSMDIFQLEAMPQFSGKRSALLPTHVKMQSQGVSQVEADVTYQFDADGNVLEQKFTGKLYSMSTLTMALAY